MAEWQFAHKGLLWLLAMLPLLVAYYVFVDRKKQAKVRFPTLKPFEHWRPSLKQWVYHGMFALRLLALALIILAAARPQSSTSWQNVTTEGIDIVLAMDISSSMLARDFEPNRLQASKEVALKFIDDRPNDRIGLVIYSGETFTQVPLTTDHAKLKSLLEEVENGMIKDGTAIGMGLANAVNRLKESKAKSKVVILLTDGENTAGSIPPITAAEIAKTFGVKVYTIGVGTNGKAPMPVQDVFGRIHYQPMDVRIDEATLTKIADITGGKYFRATNNEKLVKVYNEIDQLEKTIIEETQYEKKSEEFWWFALAASCLLIVEFLTRNLYLRGIVS